MLRIVPMPLATYMNSTRSASAGSLGMCACISASAGIRNFPRPSMRILSDGGFMIPESPDPMVMMPPRFTNPDCRVVDHLLRNHRDDGHMFEHRQGVGLRGGPVG